VVVENVDENFVIIDGPVKRKRCNINHLEPLSNTTSIKKGATHSEVTSVFKSLKLEVRENEGRKEQERNKETTGKVRRVSARKPTDTAVTGTAK
jgi:ribosomal protein L14E/L6E/L27E